MGVHGSRLYFSLHALRNIFLILPVVVIMEVILAQSMMTAGPPYPLHMSYFCSSCGITQSTSLISIIRVRAALNLRHYLSLSFTLSLPH